MSDYKFPELPSDEELGITKEDREKYGEDLPDDGPEMSDAELAALLGEAPRAPSGDKGPAGAAAAAAAGKPTREQKKAAKKAAKAKKAAERDARALAKKAAKEEKAALAAQKKAAGTGGTATGPGAGAGADPSPAGADAEASVAAAVAAAISARGGSEKAAAGGKKGGSAGDAGKGDGPDAPAAAGASPEPAGSRSRWRGPVTAAALLATAIFASSRTGVPGPVPANAPESEFSSARAMATLVEIARRAHPPGSPEHTRVRELLVARLQSLGLEPEVQTTTALVERSGGVRATTVRNVIARVPGTSSTGTLLVTAHYDSREIAVGAADDGSGVVAILEALRALQTDEPLANDLIVLFTDAEELGLMGARAFVDEHPLMADVDLVLSLEMRGGGGPSIMFETKEDNGWVVRTLEEWDDHPFANSMAYEIYRRMPNDTDFTPFREAGVQGLNFAAIDNAHVYHQVYDRPDNLSEATLQHHGLHALGALRYYGNADLTDVDDDNVVYFSVPLLGLFVYDQILVLPIAGLLLVLFAAASLAARRSGATLGRTVAGTLLSVLVLGLSYGAGYGLLQWLSGRHDELGALHGSAFHSEGWYMLALAFAAMGVTLVLTFVARRWLSLVELSLGALVVPVVGAVVLSVATPPAAMNLQWPAIAACVAVIAIAALGARQEATVGWLTALMLSVPVIVMLEPLTELVWLAMSIRLAGVLGVVMALTLLLCLPALAALRHPNGWWAPLGAFLAAAIMLGIGTLTARPSADRPAPTTLAYAYEHGSGNAVWLTSPGAEGDDADSSEARAWATERIGGPFTESRDMSAFGYVRGSVPVAPAPVVSAAPPSVVVVGDTVFEGRRLVVMHVRSQIGAESMQFHLEEGVTITAINGRAISARDVTVVEHWGIPDGDVLLELSMPVGSPIGVNIVEHLLRPEELLGTQYFTRPPDLAPNVNRLSDRAMLRFSVAALADPRHAIVPIRSPATDAVQPGLVVRDTVRAPVDTTSVDTTSIDTTSIDTAAVVRDTVDMTRDTTRAVPAGTTDTIRPGSS